MDKSDWLPMCMDDTEISFISFMKKKMLKARGPSDRRFSTTKRARIVFDWLLFSQTHPVASLPSELVVEDTSAL